MAEIRARTGLVRSLCEADILIELWGDCAGGGEERRQSAGWLMREAPVTGCPLSDNTPQFLQLRNTPISISTQNRKSPFSSTQPSPSQPAKPSENTYENYWRHRGNRRGEDPDGWYLATLLCLSLNTTPAGQKETFLFRAGGSIRRERGEFKTLEGNDNSHSHSLIASKLQWTWNLGGETAEGQKLNFVAFRERVEWGEVSTLRDLCQPSQHKHWTTASPPSQITI